MKKGTILVLGLIGITLLAGLSLSGCVTVHEVQGSKTDEGTTQQIEKGKTTRSEILKWFGEPGRIIGPGTHHGKNQEAYVYEPFETRMKFWDREFRQNTLMIWIDKDTGIVEDYGYLI